MSGHRFEVVAVDGPAASGKSSVSKELARRLGFVYVNTGALYRAVTWAALRAGADPSNVEAVELLLKQTRWEAGIEAGQSCVRVDGEEPGPALVDSRVNANVSKYAALDSVRACLLGLQRQFGDLCNSVMEGRDIGSVVFPHTPHKFYVDASLEVRVARRLGQGMDDSVAFRDAMDSARKSAPLMVPEGAFVIDSSAMSVAQVVEIMIEKLRSSGIAPVVD